MELTNPGEWLDRRIFDFIRENLKVRVDTYNNQGWVSVVARLEMNGQTISKDETGFIIPIGESEPNEVGGN